MRRSPHGGAPPPAGHNRPPLIEAATEMFCERGLDIGVGEIAQQAGVGRGTLFRNFPTKEHLIAAVVVQRPGPGHSEMMDVLDELVTRANSASCISQKRPCRLPPRSAQNAVGVVTTPARTPERKSRLTRSRTASLWRSASKPGRAHRAKWGSRTTACIARTEPPARRRRRRQRRVRGNDETPGAPSCSPGVRAAPRRTGTRSRRRGSAAALTTARGRGRRRRAQEPEPSRARSRERPSPPRASARRRSGWRRAGPPARPPHSSS